MFSVQGIEVLGTPIGTDIYIKEYVTQNGIKITRDVEKHDHLTDGFVNNVQDIKFCMNTRTQYSYAQSIVLQEFKTGTLTFFLFFSQEYNLEWDLHQLREVWTKDFV